MGHECLVANPASLYRKGRKKSDKIDAEKLARWARSDPEMLEPVQHPGADIQADMAVVHSRRALVEARTKLINRTRGMVKSWGARLPRCDAAYFHARVVSHVPPELKSAVEPLITIIASLTGQIELLEEQIETLAMNKYGENMRRLTQVKGVGTITALTYVLTLRQPERFPRSRQVGPYLGLTPRLDQSGESDIPHSISKAGNTYLRVLLVQGAHHILERGPDTDLKRWGQRKAEGGKRAKRRAVVAVARKLAVLLHHLWRSGEDYQPLRQAAA
jgi:transposase